MTEPTLPAGLPAPLAAALAARGYIKLTPVQQAVLADGLAGRDLLVSAQTGSGKTVAFGLAIAPDVLGTAPEQALPDPAAPLALVVAPTRELALQVRREFDWLYDCATVASCVGGMDYRTERRALERGAHIVVGTPGRLRDHVERRSLDLSALRAVVLDEADEMLDLGFREDLEFLLSQAPAGRRTLLFSATVPPAIEELARAFQREAARVVAGGEPRQHADIAYMAFSVPPRDREGAIFNLLRFHEARAALVFCKTRANVNHLAARMGNRGFRVVALSGEFSQEARTLALQSLRDGRARVCIATDVAARGIDLPGLELVIHADLPANAETLLHRSGRTGRAGAKGISALVVTPAEFRKASRLLREAKVEAVWGRPPSADEVQAREDARLLDHPFLAPPEAEETALAQAILDRHGASASAAAFVRLWREGRAAPEVLSDMADAPPPAPARPRGDFGPSVWFSLPVGRAGRAEARWLLPKLCDAGGIGKDAIGAIRVQEAETYVQIAADRAAAFADGQEIGPGLTLRRLEGEPPDRPRPPGRGEDRRGGRPPRGAPPELPRRSRAAQADRGAADGAPQAEVPRPPETSRPRPAPAPLETPRPPRTREGQAGPRPWPEDRAARRSPQPAPAAAEGTAPGPRPADAPGAWGKPRRPRPAQEAGAPGPAAGGRPWKTRPTGPGGAAAAGEAPRKPRWKGGKPPGKPAPGGESPPRRPAAAGWTPQGPAAAAGGGPGAKPARSAGFRSHKSGDRPHRPAKPPPDPRDPSRRFVPPKPPGPKPKS